MMSTVKASNQPWSRMVCQWAAVVLRLPGYAVLHSTTVPCTRSIIGRQNSGGRKFWLPFSPECSFTATFPDSSRPQAS